MRVFLVSFEISVFESEVKPTGRTSKPDYVFEGEFDKDDDVSFGKLCELEFRVQHLVKSFVDLGYKVTALRKEVCHLEI